MIRVRLVQVLMILVLFSVLTACGSQSIRTIDIKSVQKTEPAGTAPSYKIGPGDQLDIFVWGNPDLSRAVVVRPDGYITAPLVEDVHASGSTAEALSSAIEEKLSKYIKTPNVTVSISSFVGRYDEQVRVVGQAAQPQALSYRENMTVLDVIIAVGGLTEFADGNGATIVRKIDGEKVQFEVHLDDLIKQGNISENIEMQPGDILIIPESWF
ncbi:MAG: polysaccharide export protein [Candidatus Polarisedimenticolaceae bacterium]|nr:polysaccharide export protein [Candidatus Polarisedimenticolaceae bacterium]